MKVLSKKSLFALAAVSVIAVSSTGYAATMNGTKSSQEATLAMNSKASLHQAMNLAKQKVAGDIISAEFDGDNQGEYEVKLIQGNTRLKSMPQRAKSSKPNKKAWIKRTWRKWLLGVSQKFSSTKPSPLHSKPRQGR